MSALTSRKTDKNDDGTFATGLIFLDWLKKTNQSAWQILPLNETQLEPGSSTKHIPSPYKSYGIGLDPKYLSESFVGMYPSSSEKRDFVAAPLMEIMLPGISAPPSPTSKAAMKPARLRRMSRRKSKACSCQPSENCCVHDREARPPDPWWFFERPVRTFSA